MINIRLATEGDKEGWNRVVEQSDNGTIYHTWEWKAVFERETKEKNYPIIAEKNGDIVGIFPAFIRPLNKTGKKSLDLIIDKLNLKILWSPDPLNVWGYGGPCILFSENKKVLDSMFGYLYEICKKSKNMTDCKIRPFCIQGLEDILSIDNSFKVRVDRTAFVDLSISIEKLQNRLKKQHREAIRQAERKGVSIIEAKTESNIKEFYDVILEELVQRAGMYKPPYSHFKAIWDVLVPKKMAKVFFAEYENKKIGTLINFYYKDIVFCGHHATLRDFTKLRPSNLLIWHTILDSKQLGYKTLDLTGMPGNREHGIYRFKEGWGVKIEEVNWYSKRVRFKMVRDVKKRLKR
jgi:lipid II:glycine glycyltransferase (peptidoglycan interpeptide bridge formation enzyme)